MPRKSSRNGLSRTCCMKGSLSGAGSLSRPLVLCSSVTSVPPSRAGTAPPCGVRRTCSNPVRRGRRVALPESLPERRPALTGQRTAVLPASSRQDPAIFGRRDAKACLAGAHDCVICTLTKVKDMGESGEQGHPRPPEDPIHAGVAGVHRRMNDAPPPALLRGAGHAGPAVPRGFRPMSQSRDKTDTPALPGLPIPPQDTKPRRTG